MNAPKKESPESEDAALGRSLKGWANEVLEKFRIHIFLTLIAALLGLGSREYIRDQQPTPSAPSVDLHALFTEMHQVHRDMVEVKVMSQAIVDSLPENERVKAKGLIADRMAVLRLADERMAQ